MLSHIFSLFIVLGPYFGCQAVLGSRPYKNCSHGDLFQILGPQKITIFESGLKTLFHFFFRVFIISISGWRTLLKSKQALSTVWFFNCSLPKMSKYKKKQSIQTVPMGTVLKCLVMV